MLGWELPPRNTGGLGVACYGLAKGLAQHGVKIAFGLPMPLDQEVDFMTLIDSPIDNVTITQINANLMPYANNHSYLQQKQYQVVKNSSKSLYEESLNYAIKAANWAETVNHQIIHAHDWMTYPAAIKARERSNKPFIAHVHATEYDRTGGNVDHRIADIEYHGLHSADQIITVSNYTKQKVMENYRIPENKIEVIHNGVDAAEFSLKQIKRIFPHDHIVAYVGRLTFQKGVEYFLKMAKEVLISHPQTIFIVAGTGDMYERHVLEAAHLNISKRTIFTGFLTGEKLKSVYHMADVFVMPSVSEPYGIVALEALAAGTPIIISKQSGVAETVKHALKVDYWDVNKMAYLVRRILDNQHKVANMVKLGQKEVQRLTWNRAARKTINVYQRYI